jgi:hypothetical protein
MLPVGRKVCALTDELLATFTSNSPQIMAQRIMRLRRIEPPTPLTSAMIRICFCWEGGCGERRVKQRFLTYLVFIGFFSSFVFVQKATSLSGNPIGHDNPRRTFSKRRQNIVPTNLFVLLKADAGLVPLRTAVECEARVSVFSKFPCIPRDSYIGFVDNHQTHAEFYGREQSSL